MAFGTSNKRRQRRLQNENDFKISGQPSDHVPLFILTAGKTPLSQRNQLDLFFKTLQLVRHKLQVFFLLGHRQTNYRNITIL